jgi:hypothetical protein
MLVNYPSDIEKTVLALAECNRQSAELRELLAGTEAIIIQDIAAARTPEGKPQFSNESVRAAELTLRMRADAEASDLKQQIERGEMQKQQHLARLERLRGEFKIYLLERQAEFAARTSSDTV